ncbi:ComEA family DNA-binding protein [Vibrio panuliri]|uniref:Helix-hairpin-helix DNA-binding motif class 1 domain-containing protein n=1 Tax=Vibrio panuliri TaxID=1381081 RepID=A0A1Q9HJQ9_9VIBR|nr:helix-hairpin-helix domain-containing protein [Vibrio panuliri]KAB1453907.1 hypothetical protein F7O85_13450 [Vibrio panuliri]OLQ83972.1 hypothetical protein BIY20_04140 [Vibrio panuliri]OLQ90547.1 hypothetical protein BIY22_06020 [Vibrio panuliri]
MRITTLFVTFLLALTSTFALADEQPKENPKYEGIEVVVNVNQASAQEIADLLQGIGLKKAQAIVEYRQQHGAFEKIDDLAKVSGIGEATVAKNVARIKL